MCHFFCAGALHRYDHTGCPRCFGHVIFRHRSCGDLSWTLFCFICFAEGLCLRPPFPSEVNMQMYVYKCEEWIRTAKTSIFSSSAFSWQISGACKGAGMKVPTVRPSQKEFAKPPAFLKHSFKRKAKTRLSQLTFVARLDLVTVVVAGRSSTYEYE